MGNALPLINGARITEATLGVYLPSRCSDDATADAVSVNMSGTAFTDFSTTASTTPIRARVFADGIWEEWSDNLGGDDLSAAFDITSDAAGQDFAEALRAYWVANGQVPTFYLGLVRGRRIVGSPVRALNRPGRWTGAFVISSAVALTAAATMPFTGIAGLARPMSHQRRFARF